MFNKIQSKYFPCFQPKVIKDLRVLVDHKRSTLPVDNSDKTASVLGFISPTCLCTAFTSTDPQSAKRQSSHQCHFALLGSAHVKSARKMLVKSTPDFWLVFFYYSNNINQLYIRWLLLFILLIKANLISK